MALNKSAYLDSWFSVKKEIIGELKETSWSIKSLIKTNSKINKGELNIIDTLIDELSTLDINTDTINTIHQMKTK